MGISSILAVSLLLTFFFQNNVYFLLRKVSKFDFEMVINNFFTEFIYDFGKVPKQILVLFPILASFFLAGNF